MDGEVAYGTLISLDGTEKVIQYNSSMTQNVESINFEEVTTRKKIRVVKLAILSVCVAISAHF